MFLLRSESLWQRTNVPFEFAIKVRKRNTYVWRRTNVPFEFDIKVRKRNTYVWRYRSRYDNRRHFGDFRRLYWETSCQLSTYLEREREVNELICHLFSTSHQNTNKVILLLIEQRSTILYCWYENPIHMQLLYLYLLLSYSCTIIIISSFVSFFVFNVHIDRHDGRVLGRRRTTCQQQQQQQQWTSGTTSSSSSSSSSNRTFHATCWITSSQLAMPCYRCKCRWGSRNVCWHG